MSRNSCPKSSAVARGCLRIWASPRVHLDSGGHQVADQNAWPCDPKGAVDQQAFGKSRKCRRRRFGVFTDDRAGIFPRSASGVDIDRGRSLRGGQRRATRPRVGRARPAPGRPRGTITSILSTPCSIAHLGPVAVGNQLDRSSAKSAARRPVTSAAWIAMDECRLSDTSHARSRHCPEFQAECARIGGHMGGFHRSTPIKRQSACEPRSMCRPFGRSQRRSPRSNRIGSCAHSAQSVTHCPAPRPRPASTVHPSQATDPFRGQSPCPWRSAARISARVCPDRIGGCGQGKALASGRRGCKDRSAARQRGPIAVMGSRSISGSCPWQYHIVAVNKAQRGLYTQGFQQLAALR